MNDKRTGAYSYDVLLVSKALSDIERLDYSYIYAGEITVMREDGEELADIWWDSEAETWRVDWKR